MAFRREGGLPLGGGHGLASLTDIRTLTIAPVFPPGGHPSDSARLHAPVRQRLRRGPASYLSQHRNTASYLSGSLSFHENRCPAPAIAILRAVEQLYRGIDRLDSSTRWRSNIPPSQKHLSPYREAFVIRRSVAGSGRDENRVTVRRRCSTRLIC